MNDQLVLIQPNSTNTSKEWQLDPATREIGRRGVILARQALQHRGAGASADRYQTADTLQPSATNNNVRTNRLATAA